MFVRKKKVKGKIYFYGVLTFRLPGKKFKKFTIYLGKQKPSEKQLHEKEQKLIDRIYLQRLAGFKLKYLTKEEAIKVDLVKDSFLEKYGKLNAREKDLFIRDQTINFVYTTLRTENVLVSRKDVSTAYDLFDDASKRVVKSENILICANMISGLNFAKSKQTLTKDFVKKLHEIVMYAFEEKKPGQIRREQVYIMRALKSQLFSEEIGYRPPKASEINKELSKFFKWLDENRNVYPLELAALIHIKFYKIHPFYDGNKRTARLLFNKILFDNGYPILNISENTTDYFEALVDSVEKNKEKMFVKYVYDYFVNKYSKIKLGTT